MKKLLTVALVGCIAASSLFAFAACSGSTDYDHTIKFYSSQGQSLAAVTDKAIEAFEKKYPGWKVEHTQPGGYNEVLSKIRSDLQAGLQPDLAYCYSDHVAQYLATGKVVDMKQYLTNAESYTYTVNGEEHTIDRIGFTEDEVNNQFIKGYYEEGFASNYTGYEEVGLKADSVITLPFVKSTELLYYNPDSLHAMGYKEAPTTWDELWKISREALAKWSSCTPLGYDSEANWFITMAEQKGFGYTSPDKDNHYLFNNEDAVKWLTEIKKYYVEGLITTQQIYGSYTSGLFIKGPKDGGLVFCIGSSGGASNQSGGDLFTTEVAPIPGWVDADGEMHNDCISQGPSLVMLSGGNGVANPTEKQIMTFQFIKELLDVDFQAKFAMESGYNPMRNDVFEQEKYATFLQGKDPETGDKLTGAKLVVSKAANAAKELTERFFVSPAFVGSSVARDQMTSVVQYVLLDQKDPDIALRDAYKNCGGK